MDQILQQYVNIIDADPGVDTVNGFTGGGRRRRHQFGPHVHFAEASAGTRRSDGRRDHRPLAPQAGAGSGRHPVTCRRAGCARGRTAEQRAIPVHHARRQCRRTERLRAPRCSLKLRAIPIIADVNTDQQNRGLDGLVDYDRDTAARFGISPQLIDNTLYDAFGQRQVSTMYTPL